MTQVVELDIAEGKAFRLNARKSSVTDFATAFIDAAVEQVRGGAAANQITDPEMLSEAFLQALGGRIDYLMSHLDDEKRALLLEWLVTSVVGGFAQDFLRRFAGALSAASTPPPEGGGPIGGEPTP